MPRSKPMPKTPSPRRRGRPPGSKNRPKAVDPTKLEDDGADAQAAVVATVVGEGLAGYSRTKFYTRATNSHDHQRNVQAGFPRDLHGRMHAMVELVTEYRSLQDLVRDAVYHRLVELDAIYNPDADPGYRAQMHLLAEQERQSERSATRRAVVAGATEIFERLVGAGDVSALTETIAMHQMLMGGLEDEVREQVERVVEDAQEELERLVKRRGG